ncbi:MAG TPA: hypothetical protein VM120_06460 [Bryobacteraceae bacterium]|nr:hypothetical protein [Bryobacteraceae bacterium]
MGSRSIVAALVACVTLETSLPAREPQVICGAERGTVKEELFLHQQSMNTRRKLGLRTAAGPVGKDIGDIAILYDSGGVVARRNPINLASKGITFTPAAGFVRYRFTTGEMVYDEAAAGGGTLLAGLGDDDTRRVSLPFPFPFFGARYAEIWVNSDGNISFTEGDANPATKTIGLLSGGPPRIAPLFSDLDPSRSVKGVMVFAEAAKVVVTWLEVPEFGGGRPQTFQVRLYPDGHFEFAYPVASAREAVTGISPGRPAGVTELVSFSQGSSSDFFATVAERFTNSDALDTVLLAQRFYQAHEDAYDYLAVYNTLGIAARSFAVATELSVRTTRRAGFGDTVVDIGAQYGSANRLQAMLNMGPLTNYPRDPNAPVASRAGSGDTPLTILAHETGHLFLALASVRDEGNSQARPMLGAALAHWSFNFDSDASFLEGNRIRDNGENTSPRFTTAATVEHYSPLDQYLMGFRAPEEVPAVFLARRTGIANDRLPQAGVSFNGDRQNVTVDDIIAAEGRRSPDHTVAQRHFRTAMILVVPDGTEPSADDLAQIDTLRSSFEGFYQRAASDRAFVETSLKRNLALSIWPAAGMVQGSTVNVTVSLDSAAASDLTVSLKTRMGVATMPASVMIPAGSRQVSFAIRGLRAGVEEIAAEPGDTRYRGDRARLQVAASASNVKLEVVGGAGQVANPGVVLAGQIEIRATDINLIPYPGLLVRAAVTAPGSVAPGNAVTDGNGIARFRWTPGNGTSNELRASVDGSLDAVTVTALGRPAFTATSVLNAASYAPGVTPGALSVIFGMNLAGGRRGESAAVPWPMELAGVQVTMNGLPCAVYSVSDGQINVLAPRDLSGDGVDITVTSALGSSMVRVPLLGVSPGLFFNTETGEAAVLVAGIGLPTSVRPAAAGEYLEIYATGLGAVQVSPFLGLEETVRRPVVTLGGVGLEVSFSGLSPAVPGLYQINARVPVGLPAGKTKLRIVMDGVVGNEADVTLR